MDQMTIFYLHPCARKSAEWLHDKMLPRMAIESQFLMATAIQMRFMESDPRLPQAIFQDHPWLQWAMRSSDAMEWLLSYYVAIMEQIEKSLGRKDRSWKFQIAVREWIPLFPSVTWQDPPIIVPTDCVADDIYASYRLFYLRSKCRLGSYRRVRVPYWVRTHYDSPIDSD